MLVYDMGCNNHFGYYRCSFIRRIILQNIFRLDLEKVFQGDIQLGIGFLNWLIVRADRNPGGFDILLLPKPPK